LRPAQAVLVLALALIVFLAYLTVRVMLNDGFDVLVLISLIVLAILGFGVLGALGSSTDD
jgi:predicted neutral ceramidase superfamily lipid hydrolase